MFSSPGFKKLLHFLPIIAFGVALFIVHEELKLHDIHEIIGAVHDTPWRLVGLAAAVTLANYLILSLCDVLALRYTGHGNIAGWRVMLASFIGYAISNNAGHAWATGGSVRYRFYSAWGVSGFDVARISLFLGATYLLGVFTLGFGGVALMPDDLRVHLANPRIVYGVMGVCATFLAIYWGLVLFYREPFRIRGVEFRLPSPRIALAQTLVACLDLVLAALVFWIFLSSDVKLGFETFIVIFVIAQAIGIISQVPGGIGVFEGAFLWLLSGMVTQQDHLELIGALVLYRTVYYFLPLMLAGVGLLGYEIRARKKDLDEGGRAVARIISATMPQAFSILLMVAGGALLVSGFTPSLPEHIKWLRDVVPLPVVEISHMVNALIGVMLLFLARGIFLRLDAAWYMSIIVLSLGFVVSILKGADWNVAAAMAAMIALLLPARGYFRRKASLFDMTLSWPWLAIAAIVVIGSAWLGFFAFRHVDYADNLWLQFSYRGDAPRFLRALLVIGVVILGYAMARILSVAHPKSLPGPSDVDLMEAEIIVRAGAQAYGYLALTRDKSLLWSDDRKAFIMFTATPKYWIAMGDPVGDPDAYEDLIWKFREQADTYNAKAVFYQASERHLPLYLDLGLQLLKIGQIARVKLAGFNLEGGKRENQRKNLNRYRREGFGFAVIDRGGVPALLPKLRAISDDWLDSKSGREKEFSMGFFDDEYISRTRVATVRDPSGKLVAFANLWESGGKTEIAIDLMRYASDSPPSMMEYLFCELLFWAQEQGYEWFNLGMAPLSGMERHHLAPIWHKIGAVIYDMADEFYNFEGLEDYKSKFGPEWSPRYLAAPAGLSAPLILMTIARLISGGWKGLFAK